MTLYNRLINQIKDILPDGRFFSYEKSFLKQNDKNVILFGKDTAFELGGSQLPCVSTMAVSSDIVFENGTVLIGRDLTEIKTDSSFGKIVFLQIDNVNEEEAFDKIKALELIRYHFCPDGFMSRASALNMREQIRVGKKAVKSKITFADYGNALIEQYLKNPIVKRAQIVFITDFERFDELHKIADKIKSTTSALNHIFDNIMFDCSSCNLKEICDEVEGMRELHFKKTKEHAQ